MDCVVAGLDKNPAEAERHGGGIAILAGKSRGAFGYSRELRRKVLSNTSKGSIIHSHGLWMYPGMVARKAAAVSGASLVISAHGMLDDWALRNSALKKRAAGWLFENRNLRQAACLHALCGAEAKSYRDYGLRNPICIIPNGIDPPEGGSQKTENKKQKSGKKVLLYLGRIHPKKGLVNLLKAWAAIPQPGWVLDIVGWDQGGHERELKALSSALGVEDSVRFPGPRFGDEKAACYHHCDAFILPSFSEGLPMAVLEAWAHGKPVLMTPQCNLPEGFTANAAIQIEPDAESIAAGLDFLFRASGDQIQTLGKNGISLVAARFNWVRCAREMVEVYRWLLGIGAKPDCVFAD
jgi:poly(glycerol-phosphate) alpha-glucosyltransferase